MKTIIFFIIFLPLYLTVQAQINTDSIFVVAINNAKNKKYEEAIENAQKVLKIHPNRYDIIIFLANVNAWQGKYPEAIQHINKAYSINKSYDELYDSWLNILLWSKNYKKLIKICELAKANNYANTYNIVLKKTLAYKGLSNYDAGIDYIEANEIFLDSIAIETTYNQMIRQNKNKAASLFYAIDIFENNSPDPQHLAYADYAFKIRKHTFITRLNYANRFNLNDLLLEADYYHLLKNGQYLYSNYGFGFKKDLFPQHRAGLEYFSPFLTTFEASAGGRFMNFGNKSTYIITGHLGKYINNLWLSVRPYYVIHTIKNTLSTAVNIRYYGKNPSDYWGLEFLYGNSPDERYAITQSGEIFMLKNYRLKIEKNTTLYKTNELKLSAAYAKEEFISGKYRNRVTFEILLKHRF